MLILAIAFSVSCEKDDDDGKVDENGLTKEINNLVPQSTLDEIERLGMPINTGANPPSIENTYLASPFILYSSNRPGDDIGYKFADYLMKFYQQDNANLKIKLDYENGPESGSGIGGFIVGADNEFTVFAEMTSVAYGETVTMVHILSGKVTDEGINNLYFANFMIDNNGNPNGYWIEDGEGRVIYDQDGFSPIVSSKNSEKNEKTGNGAGNALTEL